MQNKFKRGAASFYIVVFTTLILLILAVSFATVIISEMERTSNDDLSQSAYDSAMAGVEEAKLAFYNYRTCKTSGSEEPLCRRIINLMENKYDCFMVARMLGRIGVDEESEVVLEDDYTQTAGGEQVSNNMQQAYTCVKLQTVLQDYRSSLSGTDTTRTIKVDLAGGVKAEDIKTVKISWYSGVEPQKYTNIDAVGGAIFPQVGAKATATPPTISLAMIQTAEKFDLKDFDKTTASGETDRAMVYLVPSDKKTDGGSASKTAYVEGKGNYITASNFAKTNSMNYRNLPYTVYCNDTGEFACSTIIELPKVVPSYGTTKRNDDTFMFVVTLPYGRPATDFALELFCENGRKCGTQKVETADEDGNVIVTETQTSQANFSGVQVKIDSTGRANDLYRRVEVRMESAVDSSYISLLGPLELMKGDSPDGDNTGGLIKQYISTAEYNF